MQPAGSFLVIFGSIFGTCFAIFATDPDATRTVIEIIESRNLKAEVHEVTTDDGYILTIHRIVNESSPVQYKRPVIVQHGLESSSVDFCLNSPGLGTEFSTVSFDGKVVGNNLAFALIMHEYDVWLPNSRGNKFSQKHVSLDADKDSRYWDFSFDEMIEYDLPAVIKYILKLTKRETVGYVAHSQGTEIMFGLLAQQPKYSEIIQPAIMLAPVAHLTHTKSPFKIVADIPFFSTALSYIGGDFLSLPDILQGTVSKVCQSRLAASLLCSNVMFLLCGFDSNHLNNSRIHVYLKHSPAGTSTQNILHYVSNYKSGEFRKYDYGYWGNYQQYSSPFAPTYDLKKIDSKHIALLRGDNDWLAVPEDVDFIVDQIGEHNLLLNYRVPYADWNHLDFIYGLKSAEYVHLKVVELLYNYRHLL